MIYVTQSRFDKWILFLVGALGFVSVSLVGTLKGSEVLALLVLPLYLVMRFNRLKNLLFIKILCLLIVWFLAQLVSDFVNQTELITMFKGLAHILFVITNFTFFTLALSHNCRLILWYFFGSIFSGLVTVFVMGGSGGGSVFAEERFWYSSVEPFAFPMMLVCLCYVYPRSKKLAIIILFGYGVLALFLEGRSSALVAILGVGMLAISGTKLVEKITIYRVFLVTTAGLILLYTFTMAYVTLGLNGYLGAHSAGQLSKLLNPYSVTSNLLVGRSESFFAFAAIKSKPLLGHGSGAVGDQFIGDWEQAMSLLQNGDSVTRQEGSYGRPIPTHSVVLYGFVFSGFIGGLCWLLLLNYVLKTGVVILKGYVPEMVPIAAVVTAALCWHLLFSPHGHARFTWAPYMGFAVWAYYSGLIGQSSFSAQVYPKGVKRLV